MSAVTALLLNKMHIFLHCFSRLQCSSPFFTKKKKTPKQEQNSEKTIDFCFFLHYLNFEKGIIINVTTTTPSTANKIPYDIFFSSSSSSSLSFDSSFRWNDSKKTKETERTKKKNTHTKSHNKIELMFIFDLSIS